jgi:septum formation protein
MSLILASKSPRRKELLQQIGITDFIVRPAVDPEVADLTMPPQSLVEALALHKAREVAAKYAQPDDIVLGADTIVVLGREILGKPRDAAHAREMLRSLSDRKHRVYTGLALIHNGDEYLSHEHTEVHFRPLSDGEIDAYIATGEPMDKAGAYGIQGRGALFVDRIHGDYCNVVGLPVCKLGLMLAELHGTVQET